MLYESKLFTVKKNLVEKNDDLGAKMVSFLWNSHI
jgi:hypothetical protein